MHRTGASQVMRGTRYSRMEASVATICWALRIGWKKHLYAWEKFVWATVWAIVW